MLVKDIYGGSYDSIGLEDDLIASSLGKTTRSALDQVLCTREDHLSKFKQEDLAKSLLLMICYNVSQIASLTARIEGINKVYFGGSFIRGSPITMKFLKHGISYWSQVL
jgi:pantothenate kinase